MFVVCCKKTVVDRKWHEKDEKALIQNKNGSKGKTQELVKKKSHRGHGCPSVVNVVCCQVEVSATGWSLVQRSPTDCDVSECDREASTKRGVPGPYRAVEPYKKKYIQKQVQNSYMFRHRGAIIMDLSEQRNTRSARLCKYCVASLQLLKY
jgi:hypothetical protein